MWTIISSWIVELKHIRSVLLSPLPGLFFLIDPGFAHFSSDSSDLATTDHFNSSTNIMHITHLLTFGFLAAATVSGLPTTEDPKTPACLLSGNIFNGAGKECRCPPGQLKKPNRGKCGYKSFPYPKCRPDEKPYCAKSPKKYCDYGH